MQQVMLARGGGSQPARQGRRYSLHGWLGSDCRDRQGNGRAPRSHESECRRTRAQALAHPERQRVSRQAQGLDASLQRGWPRRIWKASWDGSARSTGPAAVGPRSLPCSDWPWGSRLEARGLRASSFNAQRALLDAEELLDAFEDFPWFRKATIKQLTTLAWPTPDHLYWPDLDIDLSAINSRTQYSYVCSTHSG